MSHAIKEHDKGAVGFTQVLGRTWHGIESYKHFDAEVNIEMAERVADYEVVKMPLYMQKEIPAVNGMSLKVNREVPKAFCLYRPDVDTILYPNVGEAYEIVSNMELLNFLENSLFSEYGNLKIESIGTLNNGQNMFVNINVVMHEVSGDISPTVTRLMFTNSYGGSSLTACLHQTRIVCMNTLRIATAQGKANDTLKRFRHTKNVSSHVQGHVLDLAGIVGEVHEHNEKLDFLATQSIDSAYMNTFLESLFPSENKEGRTKTLAENRKDKITEIFESKVDLVQLPDTRYKLLNAVTDFTSNTGLNSKKDTAQKFMDVAKKGSTDDINQKALQLLTV